jgi:hypothetical protein
MANSLNLVEIDQVQALNLTKFFIQSNQNIFLFGRRGVGKMLDLETELPTPSGFVKLKNLKVGDQLFDENGNICNIVQLHPIDYSPKSYRVVFDDGNTVNACADHLWITYTKNERTNKRLPKIRTTQEILQTLKTGSKQTNHSIRNSLPLNYPEKELPIPPYILGVWLGDGKSDRGNIECADKDIIAQIEKLGYDTHLLPSSINNGSKSSNYRIGKVTEFVDSYGLPHTMYRLSKQLRELNLINNKHIPDIYLRSSYQQRLELLQGLMDTDGCCLKNGKLEFCNTNANLAFQVYELILSLGIKCRIYCNESWLYDKRCADRYRIYFITKQPVFKLKRKLNNLKKSVNQCTRNTHRYIVDIQPIDPVPMRCITVDSPSHCYLVTRACIPTHNTHIAIQAAQECKLKVNYINLSVIERPDLAGYPNMNLPGDIITFKSPSFLPPLQEGQKPDSIILFDEIDKAPAEVTAPLLEILLFKKINGKPINATGCVLTGNLLNEATHSNQISTALLDRGAKYILSFNFDKWVDWAKSHGVHDMILGFLRSDPTFACGSVEDSTYASPSPRSWTLASEALSKTKELQMMDIESVTHIISGYVGNEAGLHFKIWYEHYRKFEPYVRSLIDKDNLSLDFNSLAPSEKVVFVITACYYAKQRVIADKSKNRTVYLERLCNFMIKEKVDYETTVLGLYNSFDFDFITKYKLYNCTIFFDMFNERFGNTTIKK